MKRIIAATGSVLLICLIISASAGRKQIKADSPENVQVPQANEELSSAQSTEESNSVYYTLKEFDKRVAVFESGNTEPVFVSSTYISKLPKDDQKLLSHGIKAFDKKTLNRLIEDYCS